MTEFTQASQYYRDMSEEERKALVENLTDSLMFENDKIRETVLGYFGRIDVTLEKILRKRLVF